MSETANTLSSPFVLMDVTRLNDGKLYQLLVNTEDKLWYKCVEKYTYHWDPLLNLNHEEDYTVFTDEIVPLTKEDINFLDKPVKKKKKK